MKAIKTNLKKRSIILLLGTFEPRFFDRWKKEGVNHFFVLEGRPSLESSRHTCRELMRRKILPTIIADNTAGFLFSRDLVKEVWVAYQVVDGPQVLAEVGGLILGVLAKVHRRPLYAFPGLHKNHFVGNPQEICHLAGVRTAPEGTKAYVPLVDLLSKKYVRKIHA